MNKRKIFNFLTLMGALFMLSVLAGYFYHINTRGELFQITPLEVPDNFAREFSRVIIKNRLESMSSAPFYNSEGHKKDWPDYDRQYLLVNFWASWCSPCVVELPSLEKLRKRFSGKGLEIVAISLDKNKSMDQIKEFLKNRGIGNFAAYMDLDREVENNIFMRGIPTTYLLGPEGNIRYIFEGDANWDSPASISFFEELLSSPSS
ncbi:MAG: TlpA family protein disulfide reductase [Alphaproteobacteria bacterium]|nr:TlpA family protein disulfide reductase [Alphaproteobacteria bacterium]